VALGTANAQLTLGGSVGGGKKYNTKLDGTSDTAVGTAQGLSSAISGTNYWKNFVDGDYTSDIASHVSALSGTTYTAFTTKYGSTGIKDYIDGALVSPDFKT
jgi:hypothetical protein